MPVYRINEVYPDGSLCDTGKIVECPEVNDSYGNKGKIIRPLLAAYGFDSNNYDHYYYPSSNDYSNTIHIKYNYIGDGMKLTWILVKEEFETKEED